jgi:hypothetical protein
MGRNLSLPKRHELAERCGVPEQVWTELHYQAEAARERGRRPAGSARAAKLADWGDVAGQADLFEIETDNES